MTLEKDKALFDPGFNPILNHFPSVYFEFLNLLNSTPKHSSKKKLYLVNAPILKNSLKSTVGFWKGCILWAVYLKYHFSSCPTEIAGNTMLGLTDKDIDFIENEYNILDQYFENYSSEIKKYLGIYVELPEKYKKIFDDYKEFSTLNNHFISTKMTNELKLPSSYEKEYTNEETEKLFTLIQEIIELKDLSLFIDLEYSQL